eukprot:TRINITY_DN10963_c0_g2_i1.p3 TRINITY_DN10963_c0_g2~~TRINITY_DN10963_c0_g2_i1.p3  ORF type:complete len:108 (-),score=1.42 TRINITY_DN10963_c0_g2_i1:85-408(-)
MEYLIIVFCISVAIENWYTNIEVAQPLLLKLQQGKQLYYNNTGVIDRKNFMRGFLCVQLCSNSSSDNYCLSIKLQYFYCYSDQEMQDSWINFACGNKYKISITILNF